MHRETRTVEALERRFWDALVAQDVPAATDLLAEPALMVSGHGAMRFDHAQYRKMAEQGSMVLKSFEMSDVQTTFATDDIAIVTYRVRQEMAGRGDADVTVQQMNDSSTWVRDASGAWKCVMHTETPVDAAICEAPRETG